MPPKGALVARICRHTMSARVRDRAGSIEISSMMSTLVFSMRDASRRLAASVSRSRLVRESRTPMPLQAWMVVPWPWVAAIPVEAV
jgi:hypothetical protein